jgi:hypothetical protein
MKAQGLWFGCFLLLSISSASAQSQMEAAPILTATNRLQRVFGPTAVYDGVLPEVKRRGGIASRLDLREPILPGKEFRNISVHPHTGQPQGVVLIAVRF